MNLITIFLKLSHLSITSLLGDISPRHSFPSPISKQHKSLKSMTSCHRFHHGSSNVCCVPTLDPALCYVLWALKVDSSYTEEFPVLLRNCLSLFLLYFTISCSDCCSCLPGGLLPPILTSPGLQQTAAGVMALRQPLY